MGGREKADNPPDIPTRSRQKPTRPVHPPTDTSPTPTIRGARKATTEVGPSKLPKVGISSGYGDSIPIDQRLAPSRSTLAPVHDGGRRAGPHRRRRPAGPK